jgi:pimeloyl-ACP methyl ester carboxylesterase
MATPTQWEHRMVETNGVRLHCVTAGDGPLVVLLHGFPECWYSWRHQIAALAPHFCVVAPDLRGYGDSERPPGVASYRLPLLVADVRGLLDAFGARDAVIVGHDWGGAVAWTFAMEHPAFTSRLVVMNCPHPTIFARHLAANPRQLLRSWYMFFFQIPWLPEQVVRLGDYAAIERAFRGMARRKDAFTDEDIHILKEALAKPGALTAAINYYRAAFRSEDAAALLPGPLRWLSERLGRPVREPTPAPRIAAPTLLIWAEDDVALGKELTDGMEPLFSGPFTLRYVPQCSHWVQQEQPEVVNRYLLEFLADLPARAIHSEGPR